MGVSGLSELGEMSGYTCYQHGTLVLPSTCIEDVDPTSTVYGQIDRSDYKFCLVSESIYVL